MVPLRHPELEHWVWFPSTREMWACCRVQRGATEELQDLEHLCYEERLGGSWGCSAGAEQPQGDGIHTQIPAGME